MVEIRTATDADMPALVATLGQERFFRERLGRQARGLGELFVAWVDSTPVGDVYLWREQPWEAAVREHLGWTPTINHLEVVPGWRDRGIGTALMDAAERHAIDLGYRELGLGVRRQNHAARRLYERLGYAEWPHGLVELNWDEPGPDGEALAHAMIVHWLVKSLPTRYPDVERWQAWTPTEALHRLKDSTVDWYVAAGWAIDLHLGRQTRAHEDLEIAIDRTDFPDWHGHFGDVDLYDVGPGWLRRLQLGDVPRGDHQIWAADPSTRAWRLDTFLEDRPDGAWHCHWLPTVTRPMADALARTAEGIAYLRPELVLLGKAKHCRPKDEADLAAVLPSLDEAALRRLRDGLRVASPDHPWLALV